MVTLAEIQKAQERIGKTLHHTPLDCSRTFSKMTDQQIYLKLENLQKTGSFKLRGALNKILSLSPEEANRGVIAASAGNHAQGVAFGATEANISSVIVMPEGAPIAKVSATKGYGAKVVLAGKNYDEAYQKACQIQQEEGQTFIHAFDDPAVIAGQGTLGLEIFNELPEVGTVLVPMGGGGLAAGVAVALKESNPKIKVIGVQAEGAPALVKSFRNHCYTETDSASTMADGIAVMKPGKLTYDLIQRYVDDVVTVGEAEISRAILLLLERSKMMVEGAVAVSLAATLFSGLKFSNGPVVDIISGGNIDVNLISRIIERGLIESGRRVRLSMLVPDRPGTLNRILEVIAENKANVVQIYHSMSAQCVGIGQIEVDLILETKDKTHAEGIVDVLEKRGFSVSFK